MMYDRRDGQRLTWQDIATAFILVAMALLVIHGALGVLGASLGL